MPNSPRDHDYLHQHNILDGSVRNEYLMKCYISSYMVDKIRYMDRSLPSIEKCQEIHERTSTRRKVDGRPRTGHLVTIISTTIIIPTSHRLDHLPGLPPLSALVVRLVQLEPRRDEVLIPLDDQVASASRASSSFARLYRTNTIFSTHRRHGSSSQRRHKQRTRRRV